jgi:hypothetical protein
VNARERLERRLRIALPADSATAAVADLDAYRAEVLAEAATHVEAESHSTLVQEGGKFQAGMQFAAELLRDGLAAKPPTPASLCDCGTPIPADQRKAYCSDRCRWADQDHGSDEGDGGDEL